MVGINLTDINWGEVNQIYGKDGELVVLIKKRIKKEFSQGNDLIKRFLREWFYIKGEISQQKISEHLLAPDTLGKIETFAKLICDELWGNANLYQALLQFRAVANKKTNASPQSADLKKLTVFLDEQHIQAKMFDVLDAEGNKLWELTKKDVQSADKAEITIALGEKCGAEIDKLMIACRKVFNYTEFQKEYRNSVLNAIGVSVCPYCNRQYITAYGKGDSRRNTGDIEHFYDKDRYPILALSLYNFIPSCQICNSRFKRTKDFYAAPHVNPYQKSFGRDARFVIDNIEAIVDARYKPIIKLRFDPDMKEIANSAETFHMEELYENHLDYVEEIIKKAKIFNASQLKEYLDQYEGMFLSKGELYRTIYGNYLEEENQGKRPLSKLTQDLLLDLSVEIE